MKKSDLIAGKRYWFYISNRDNKQKSGLFTGEGIAGESDMNDLYVYNEDGEAK